MPQVYAGADVFDGTVLHRGAALVVEGGVVQGIVPAGDATAGDVVRLPGGILAPGFIDLQVNGGGGWQVDGSADATRLAALCDVQARLGATGILPTLITDTPEATARVIAAGVAAKGTPGFLGLHLEGPHLDPRRKGAHDPALIRPMDEADLARLLDAAAALPALMLTVAPEAVTPDQIGRLAAAGVVVSLGHSDCDAATAFRAIAAGARCATHLFNAMSPLGNREPGLVGAVLTGSLAAGLIADGLHVAPATMRVALAARADGIFLVSDCMGVAGTDATDLVLGGRRILRAGGRLTLQDGTLAGADLTLDRAVAVLVREVGVASARALAMATSVPAGVMGLQDSHGHLAPGRAADMVHLDDGLALRAVWRGGVPVLP
ncbi:MAG: N-acetylglucosamine-6-phosphate deacetylase [Gemmobacter sp.]